MSCPYDLLRSFAAVNLRLDKNAFRASSIAWHVRICVSAKSLSSLLAPVKQTTAPTRNALLSPSGVLVSVSGRNHVTSLPRCSAKLPTPVRVQLPRLFSAKVARLARRIHGPEKGQTLWTGTCFKNSPDTPSAADDGVVHLVGVDAMATSDESHRYCHRCLP